MMRVDKRLLDRLRMATCIAYGVRSLYTSLSQSMMLQGVREAIAGEQ